MSLLGAHECAQQMGPVTSGFGVERTEIRRVELREMVVAMDRERHSSADKCATYVF